MSHLSKKVLGTGAAMVALSAFVPNPFLIGEAMAQATAQDTMNITAKVINPLDINQITKFDFGSFAPGALDGRLLVPATGGAPAITLGDGVIVGAAILGKVSMTAPKSATFTIELADLKTNSIKLANGTGGSTKKTILVDQILLKGTAKLSLSGKVSGTAAFVKGANTNATAKIVDAGGIAAANIGGRLNYKNDNVVGDYLGSYDLLITF